jgi:Domain of unknown function (DUF4136)
MKISHWLLIALLLFTGVSANPQKVAVGFDRSADFSRFKTYSWTKGVPARNPQIDALIISNIEQQLEAKGLRRTSETADVLVSYHAAVMNTFDQATVARPGTWGPYSGSMEQVWQVVKGALIVELKNASTNDEVWRATATDTLSNDGNLDVSKDMPKATKKIKKAVEKMFKGYPPGK